MWTGVGNDETTVRKSFIVVISELVDRRLARGGESELSPVSLDDVSWWVVGVVGHMKVDVIVLVHHVQFTGVGVVGVKELRGPRSLEIP
jgi:hypothetical protein